MGISPSRSRSGQIFTVDLAASAAVFLVIVNLSLLTWTIAYQNKVMFTDERAMRNDVVRTSDLLVRTPGYPEQWDATNVRIAGFTQPDHVLDNQKLEAFSTLEYQQQKVVLRASPHEFFLNISVDGKPLHITGASGDSLGGKPVAYTVQEGAQMSDVRILDVLNESSVTWDLYWPSPSTDSDKLASLTANHVYNYTNKGATMFDDMLENVSDGDYGTVIAEKPNLDSDDISNEDMLSDFVAGGGTYLQVGENTALLNELWGFDVVSANGDPGIVRKTSPLLNDSLQVGDKIRFKNIADAYANVTTTFVEDSQDPFGCLACMWKNGSGKIYYLSDTLYQDESDATTSFIDADKAFSTDIPLVFGKEVPGNASTAVVNQRSALISNVSFGSGAGGETLVGRQPVAYIVEAGQHLSDYAIIDALNASDIDWDLYWPSDNDKALLDSLTAEHVYNYTTQGDDMFDDLVANASDGAYNTIVAENTNVDISNINESGLENWVSGGGTYLHTEERAAMLRDTFGFNDASGSNVGEVVRVDPLLNGSFAVGDTLQWEESLPMAFENPDTVFVNDTSSPFACHACHWDYGDGKVYYVPDTFTDSDAVTTFQEARNAFPVDETDRITRQRQATIRLVFWNAD